MSHIAPRLVLALAALALATACSSSLDRVEKLSQVDIPVEDRAMAALPTAGDTEAAQTQARGLFGAMFRRTPAEPSASLEADAVIENGETGEVVEETAAAAEPERNGGLLGLFSGAGAQPQATEEGVEVASLEPQADVAPQRGGLFGRRQQSAQQDDGIAFGTVPTYGEVARVCNFPRNGLGREVASYPERRPTYRIYDSNPGSTARRAFYVTGFEDDCVRVFSGALAMFGSAEMHEQLRYGLPAKVQPYSSTDTAYEQVKSRICRVGKGKPCGSAMSKLERDTVFVSVYENFGSNARWANILLSQGDVAATDIKTN
ncbi:hypothetical protein [Mesobacterium pallidum]|uniref:hypothetical protein n=1 Tax=Mesobacterium pallidum TaxID=2872037 RepID=UPI001EE38194|nr:hypothetical protein [Mesobacterium pallidum]